MKHNLPYPEYTSDLVYCKNIQKKFGKTFYLATLFLSPPERDATFILYAFFRFPDEYVDTYFAKQKDVALLKLSLWRDAWRSCYESKDGAVIDFDDEKQKVLRATSYIFKKYNIPFKYSEAFLDAMIQDTSKERYQNYKELEDYMYGSATVVGFMMTYIICAKDKNFHTNFDYRESVLAGARALGEAFQLTNFLRDIGEDFLERGRIYIPLDEMNRFDVNEKDLIDKNLSQSFVDLMKFQIERTRQLYEKADKAVPLLPKRAGRGIYVARVLYSKILDKIEQSDFNVFSFRVYLSKPRKIYEAVCAIIKFKII
jgi:phytoene synthase